MRNLLTYKAARRFNGRRYTLYIPYTLTKSEAKQMAKSAKLREWSRVRIVPWQGKYLVYVAH